MKKSVLSNLSLILLLTLIIPVYASIELKATIGQDIHIVLDLRNINATLYGRIRDENLINETKIPGIIMKNLKEKGLENVDFGLPPEPLSFDDTEKWITVRFYLFGSDIIKFTFSRETMRRTCHVRTDWRKFELNLTDDFSLNFTEYFGKSISMSPPWQLISYTDLENKTYPAYYCNYTSPSSFDPECYFILPREATDVHVEETEEMETIVFELPPSLRESLLNSPFLILGAIIIAIIVASLYRSIRKSEEHELES